MEAYSLKIQTKEPLFPYIAFCPHFTPATDKRPGQKLALKHGAIVINLELWHSCLWLFVKRVWKSFEL